MAGETFLQVLQICKGKAPGRKKDEGQESLCLTGFFVFFTMFSGWAQDPAGPSLRSVSVVNGGQILMLKVERDMEAVPQVIHIFWLCHPGGQVNIVIDYLVA